MSTLHEAEFLKAICSQLDTSIEHLDPVLTDRLHAMRQAALLPMFSAAAHQHDSEELLQEARNSLNRTAQLTPEINAQLDSARRLAVARMRQRNTNLFQLLYSRMQYGIANLLQMSQIARPANMIATACVLVTVVSLSYVSTRPAGTLALDDEIALIASAEDFELVENLEFYLWLAENGLPN